MALNGTEQAILGRVHYHIGNLQLLIKKLLTTVHLLQVIQQVHPPATEYSLSVQRICLASKATARLKLALRLPLNSSGLTSLNIL